MLIEGIFLLEKHTNVFDELKECGVDFRVSHGATAISSWANQSLVTYQIPKVIECAGPIFDVCQSLRKGVDSPIGPRKIATGLEHLSIDCFLAKSLAGGMGR